MIRSRVGRVLHAEGAEGGASRWVNGALAMLILVNIAGAALETVPRAQARFASILGAIEALSVAVFTVECLLRLWVCVELPMYAHPVFGRMRYLLTPMSLIDLLAIAPFYLPHLGVNLITLRAFRFLSIFWLTVTIQPMLPTTWLRTEWKGRLSPG